jgi:hypothetical protein
MSEFSLTSHPSISIKRKELKQEPPSSEFKKINDNSGREISNTHYSVG